MASGGSSRHLHKKGFRSGGYRLPSRYAIGMAYWSKVEGRLAGGERMAVYLAARNGRISAAAIENDEHPHSEAEFLSRLDRNEPWDPWPGGTGAGLLDAAAMQVEEYFSGRLLAFHLPLGLAGTDFQERVWRELLKIPLGETRTYGDIAQQIGKPAAVRAVGNANGRNHLPLIVPCHRVVASDGKLGGYTGGLGLKRSLLAHEASVALRRKMARVETGT